MNSKAKYHYLKKASFSFFCKYELMKMQLGKTKLRLIFVILFYLKLKVQLPYEIQMQMFPMLFFSLFKFLKDYYAPKCKILEYAWII